MKFFVSSSINPSKDLFALTLLMFLFPTLLFANDAERSNVRVKSDKASETIQTSQNTNQNKMTDKQKKLLKKSHKNTRTKNSPQPMTRSGLQEVNPAHPSKKPISPPDKRDALGNLQNSVNLKTSVAVEFSLRDSRWASSASDKKALKKLCEKIKVFAKVPNSKIEKLNPSYQTKYITANIAGQSVAKGFKACVTEFKSVPVNSDVHFIATLSDSKYTLSQKLKKSKFSLSKGQSVTFYLERK